MQTMQEYKCPCCGGAIEFNSSLQKMKCPYCDTEFEMETLQGYDAALQEDAADHMEWETAAGGEWQEGEADGLRGTAKRTTECRFTSANPAAARLWAMPIWRPHPVRFAGTRSL